MRKVEAPTTIDTWRIICAAQSEPDFSEDRQILIYGGERDGYHNGGPFVVLDGGHCSCYDWEDVEWCAIEYTHDELMTLARSKIFGSGCYSKTEREFWRMVEHALDATQSY